MLVLCWYTSGDVLSLLDALIINTVFKLCILDVLSVLDMSDCNDEWSVDTLLDYYNTSSLADCWF